MNMKIHRHRANESGLAAIVVTMIIMVVLSLVVLGFAKVSRREQRQGIDRQLVSQARYAAESGVNDALNYLRSGGSLTSTANTQCNTYASTDGRLPKSVDSENIIEGQIANTCVLVDNSTADVVYDGVGTDSEVIFPLRAANGSNITSVTLSWEGSSGGVYSTANCPARTPDSDALTPLASWQCPAGALRVDIVPIPNGAFTRDTTISTVRSVLLYPAVNSGTASQTPTYGARLVTPCPNNSPVLPACRITLTGLTSSPAYYLRIRPIYRSANIHVTAAGPSGPLQLRGAQMTIDSTGRASDVLKRLVVRVPACSSSEACGKRPAGFALQTADSICKLFAVIPPSTIGVSDTDPSCTL